MALNFDGANDWYLTATTPVTANPVSIASWFSGAAATLETISSVADSAGTVDYIAILRNTATNCVFREVESAAPSNTGQALTSAGVALNTWAHMTGSGASDTSRTVWLNGGSAGTNATDITPGHTNTLDRIGVGATAHSTPSSGSWNGLLAAIGIWNVALSIEDAVALANGVSPLRVKRGNLVFFMACNDPNPTADIAGGRVLTKAGAPTMAQDPPNFMRGPLRGRRKRSTRM